MGPDMTYAGYYWETRPDGVPDQSKIRHACPER
jgi:hypothetical protein